MRFGESLLVRFKPRTIQKPFIIHQLDISIPEKPKTKLENGNENEKQLVVSNRTQKSETTDRKRRYSANTHANANVESNTARKHKKPSNSDDVALLFILGILFPPLWLAFLQNKTCMSVPYTQFLACEGCKGAIHFKVGGSSLILVICALFFLQECVILGLAMAHGILF